MKTVEEYFIQQHGGKTPDQSVNDGETFTAIAMTIFASEFSQQSNKELLSKIEEIQKDCDNIENRANEVEYKHLKLVQMNERFEKFLRTKGLTSEWGYFLSSTNQSQEKGDGHE